jgi:hypothetical protein
MSLRVERSALCERFEWALITLMGTSGILKYLHSNQGRKSKKRPIGVISVTETTCIYRYDAGASIRRLNASSRGRWRTRRVVWWWWGSQTDDWFKVWLLAEKGSPY